MTQHTETHAIPNFWADGNKIYGRDPDATQHTMFLAETDSTGNARFICKAVNNHDALVQMIDSLQAVLSTTLDHAKIDKSSIEADARFQLSNARLLLSNLKENK